MSDSIRVLTFTDKQVVEMVLRYWFSDPPERGLVWAQDNVTEMVRQAWLEQQQSAAHADHSADAKLAP